MPMNERGQRVKTHEDTKDTRRKDVEAASNKSQGFCPTCGQKTSTSGAAVGGGT